MNVGEYKILSPRPKVRTKSYLAILSLLLFMSACLNSANNSSSGEVEPSVTDGVAMISPWSVELSWEKLSGIDVYRIYSEAEKNTIVAETPFSSVGLALTPNTLYQYKLYKVAGGVQVTKSIKTYEFTSWPEFTTSAWTAKPKDFAGIQVSWTYAPWNTLAAKAEAKDGMQMRCSFLANPGTATDPFVTGAIVVTAPVADGVMNGGVNIAPLTEYLIGCEVVFTDGKTSRSAETHKAVSTASLVDDRTNASVEVDKNPKQTVQISRAIAIDTANTTDGVLDLNFWGVDQNNSVLENIFSMSRNNLTAGEAIYFSSPLRNVPNEIYGGKYRITGSFTSNKTGIANPIAAKDIYVKSADDPRQVLYPNITNAASAQAMGTAAASGDFDCDGYDDVAIGMPSVAWRDPSDGQIKETGVVIVYYGTANGLNYADAPDNQNFSGKPKTTNGRPPSIIVPSSDAGSYSRNGRRIRFGASLAVGNFNRDINVIDKDNRKISECKDLAIGAPDESIGAGSNINSQRPGAGGAVYIKFGSPNGIYSSGWNMFSRPSEQRSSCPAGASQPGHPSGTDLPVGFVSFNNPSLGCPGTKVYPFAVTTTNSYCNATGTGGSCVIPTPADPTDPTDTPVNSDLGIYKLLDNLPYLYTSGFSSVARFGTSVGVGDFNNDGYDDLIVGAPGAVIPSPVPPAPGGVQYANFVNAAGAAFVYFGEPTGIYQSFTASQKSPVKIQPASPAADTNMGSAVGIAMLASGATTLGAGSTTDTLDVLDSSILANNAYAVVGASGYSSSAGALYTNQFDPTSITNPVKKVFPAVTGNTGARMGAAIAVGNFRDPRVGRCNPLDDAGCGSTPASIGLQRYNRKPYRQNVAVGAPGEQGEGRVYVFSNNFTVQSGREGGFLCDSPTNCPGNIIDPPSGLHGGFGETLNVIKTLPEYFSCDSGQCGAWKDVASGAPPLSQIRLQPVWDKNNLDVLLVGSPNTNTKGAAHYYQPSIGNGLGGNPSGALSASQLSGTNDKFGMGLGGGYFSGRTIQCGAANNCLSPYEVIIGAPNQSVFGGQSIIGGGTAFYYSGGNTNDPVDLATATKDPGNGSVLSLSVVNSSGFANARFVGDLNCDSYSDIVIPYQHNVRDHNVTELLILYGSRKGLVYNKADGSSAIPVDHNYRDSSLGARAPQWIDTRSWSEINAIDTDPTHYFASVGDVNGDECDDMVVGNKNIILLYGDSQGLVSSTPPSVDATRTAPKLVRFPTYLSDGVHTIAGDVLDALADPANSFGWKPKTDMTTGTLTTTQDLGAAPAGGADGTLPKLQPDLSSWDYWHNGGRDASYSNLANVPICHGDFNGDGYSDIVIGGINTWSDRGLAHNVNPDGTPAANYHVINVGSDHAINSQLFVFYGGPDGVQTQALSGSYDISEAPTHSPFESNCTPITGHAGSCSPAILFDPDQFVDDNSGNLIGAPFSIWRDSQIRSYTGARTFDTDKRILDRFGELCKTVGSLDGAAYDDLMIPLPDAKSTGGRQNAFVLFKGGPQGLRNTGISGTQKMAIQVYLNPSAAATAAHTANDLLTVLNASSLGWSAAGLGDVNSDGYPDIALGAPNLRNPDVVIPAPNVTDVGALMGSFVTVYGGPAFNSSIQPDSGAHLDSGYSFRRDFDLCEKAGSNATSTCQAQLVRPETVRPDATTGANMNLRMGIWVDGAGDVNADGSNDILVSVPEFSQSGKKQVGAAIVYFGTSQTNLDAGWDINNTYTPVAPSLSANCKADSLSGNHCQPLLIVPEYALGPSAQNGQKWKASGGMILKTKQNINSKKHWSFSDFGSSNIYTIDDSKAHSSDILLMPQFNFPHKDNPAFTHLGGLTVWQ